LFGKTCFKTLSNAKIMKLQY